MKAVLMAGGKGTRLLGVTNDLIPKPMALLDGKPLLQRQIETLKENGIREFVVITGHLGRVITEYFGDGAAFGVSIRYYQETEPLGTAGALAEIADWLEDDIFFLAFGDILFDIELSRMIAFHQAQKAQMTLLVHPNDHPADSDIVVLNHSGRVKAFLKKNQQRTQWYENCVNAGLYIVDRSICGRIPKGIKTDLEKDVVLPLIAEGGAVAGYRSPEYVKDIGTAERIVEAENALKQGLLKQRNLAHKQRCIFLDRDGTINQYRGLIYQDDQLVLVDSAAEAIRLINQSGYLTIVITNQPSVARGLCQAEDIERMHRKLQTLLGAQGAYLDDICYCPHHPDKGYPEENPAYKIACNCRKPGTELISQCQKQYNIDLSTSWFVGDTTVDVQTGVNAGLHTALVHTGEAGRDAKYQCKAEQEADNLLEAVQKILEV